MKHVPVIRLSPNRTRVALGAAAVATALAALAWVAQRPSPEAPAPAVRPSSGVDTWLNAGTGPAATPPPREPALHTGLEALPGSLQGTEVSGELEVDAHGQLKITRGVRLVFDYFLSATGEEPPERQRARVRAYLTYRLGATTAAVQALSLLDTYIAYKEELGRSLSNTRATQLEEMKARLSSVHALRARHFTPQVVAAFFGDEEAHDRYTLARLAILNDPTLSPAQKAARIAELRQAQPEAVRQQMDVVETVHSLDALTTDWQQRAGSAQELRQLRETLVGRDATQRLEALDRQTEAWNSRVATYLQHRAQILADATLADSMRQQQVETLRNAAFSGTERIRIETIERHQDSSARDAASSTQGAAPPG